MPEETPGKGLSPGKVVHPCKKQLTEYRHLERSLIILRFFIPYKTIWGVKEKSEECSLLSFCLILFDRYFAGIYLLITPTFLFYRQGKVFV